MEKNKNICVITGSRAEYGLLKGLMNEISINQKLNLILFVTGTHLEEKYGNTYKEIENDEFIINEKIPMNLSGDNPKDILISMSTEMKLMAEAFKKNNIDMIFILGDRYEILVAAQVALIYNIPISHLCGGDITEGAYDDAIRNAISKMAKFHFVTCESSKKNLINMNIQKENIFLVGNPGLYDILNFKPINKEIFLDQMKINKYNKNNKNILIVYHPETLLSKEENESNFNILISSLIGINTFKSTNFIFIETNADNYNNYIFLKINELKEAYNNIYSFKSVKRNIYFNFIYYSELFIGNSSSGIYEVPLFKKITLNIGKRQSGRACGKSIRHLNYHKNIIVNEIENILDSNKYINFMENYPYLVKDSSKEIIKIINNNFISNNMKSIAIIGGGGHSRVIIDALYESSKKENIKIIGFYDDNINCEEYRNIKRLGKIDEINNKDEIYYICGIGNLKTRKKIIDKLNNINWINVIHPSSIISDTVILGKGIFINAGAIINSKANIEDHCIINTNSVIEHDVSIGVNCHIAPSVTICGHVTIKKQTFIGVGSKVINKNKNGFITIGSNNFLNAGSLILHSTDNNSKIRGMH
jgi:GDP/UDP-N,N'-diacetylbacillosamine 2-epimerase (hydrolysing)